MHVPMMRVGYVRMRMAQRIVDMRVAVRLRWHHIVNMIVVPIIVTMRVLMTQRLVFMRMPVRFKEMQGDSRHHEQAARQHGPRPAPVAEAEGHGCADEGCEGEHRSRASSAKGALGQKVKAQAQPVAGSTDEKQGRRGVGCR